jgi:2-methylisocitrate lyase-like PEP mutase family enzyme
MKDTKDAVRAETDVTSRARKLRDLHREGVLVLPNAWDAASAALLAREGARAIGTTSGGIAWSLGYPDGQRITRDAMMRVVEAITRVVEVPVTADVEGGYGPEPKDAEATVRAAIAAGAVGANLEDSRASGGPLFSIEEQAARLRAAKEAAAACGLADFVLNARTDVFLFEIGEAAGRLDEVLRRASAYAQAGSDCLFVPGLLDLELLRSLVASSPLPVNAMARPTGPTVAELSRTGVRRISLGTAFAQAAYAAAQRAGRELLASGTYEALKSGIAFAEVNGILQKTSGPS